ncbi:MAG TPA: hypothetical protein VK181_20530 [Rhizobium sp.]|nr:hypothetical protein [Rhizobium sp.]
MKLIINNEIVLQAAAVAYERTTGFGGDASPLGLAREMLKATEELAEAQRVATRLQRLGRIPTVMRPTTVAGGNAAAVAAWQNVEIGKHGAQCAAQLRKNVALIQVTSGVMTTIGTSILSGGATLPMAAAAFLPIATEILFHVNNPSAEIRPIPTPLFPPAGKPAEGGKPAGNTITPIGGQDPGNAGAGGTTAPAGTGTGHHSGNAGHQGSHGHGGHDAGHGHAPNHGHQGGGHDPHAGGHGNTHDDGTGDGHDHGGHHHTGTAHAASVNDPAAAGVTAPGAAPSTQAKPADADGTSKNRRRNNG